MAAMPIDCNARENDRHVARPLRNLAPAQLAFLLDARQRLINHGQKLKDDRRGDVGHNAQRENRHAAQRAAAEEVHQSERGSALLAEQQFQLVVIHARRGNPRAQTVNGQYAQREKHPLAQVGNPEDVEKLFQHIGYPLQAPVAPVDSCNEPILRRFPVFSDYRIPGNADYAFRHTLETAFSD